MSSYTAHLAAMYGDENHVMFDLNILDDDKKLRQQITKMVGRFIYTGQERLVGNRQSCRQDLVRMPYGIPTRLFKYSGWKRVG